MTNALSITASTVVLLVLIMDPLGNLPLFIAALDGIELRRARFLVARELLIALVVLLLFLFLGHYILLLLQISRASLNISGAIILFLIAIKMVFPLSTRRRDLIVDGEPFIVPLAIPCVAGPAALTMVMLLMARNPSRWPLWLLSLIVAWGITSSLLLIASPLYRLLGDRGPAAVQRLMGLLLTAIAVEMLVKGLREAFGLGVT